MRIAIVVVALAGCSEHGSGNQTCHGLSLGACREAPGCEPDICAGCECAQSYRGCRGVGDVSEPCPALGCPTAMCCTRIQDCFGGTSCVAPGGFLGCGPCNTTPGDCTSDLDCKQQHATQICEPIACSCSPQQSACVEGCVDNSTCAEGTRCDVATNRCTPIACATNETCPTAFICNGSGICQRAPCSEDFDCDGFCVNGACFANTRGECLPVPL